MVVYINYRFQQSKRRLRKRAREDINQSGPAVCCNVPRNGWRGNSIGNWQSQTQRGTNQLGSIQPNCSSQTDCRLWSVGSSSSSSPSLMGRRSLSLSLPPFSTRKELGSCWFSLSPGGILVIIFLPRSLNSSVSSDGDSEQQQQQ